MSFTIDDVLRVSDQETLWKSMPDKAQVRAKVLGKGYRQRDIGESAERFAESLFRSTCLNSAAVCLNGKLDIYARIDTSSDVVVYDSSSHLDDVSLLSLDFPAFLNGGRRIAVPVAYRGARYGVAVFDSFNFPLEDVMVIRDCCFDFAQHTDNVWEIPILRDLVNTDSLTGVCSKRKLGVDYPQFVSNWRNLGQNFGLIFADLDLFKDINTHYGHGGGDDVLKNIAGTMRSCVRSADLIYRFGGEEFVFILPGASPSVTEERAREISDRIRYERFIVGDRQLPELTVSLGHVSTSEEGLESDDFMNIANERMLLAKGYGRDVIVSNIKFDIATGIAGMPSFLSNLENKLAQCNRSHSNGSRSAAAVLVFDVVHFSELIQRLGNRPAWDVFSDVAKWFFSERPAFDYVARVYNRDNVVVSLSSPDTERFYDAVCELGRAYLHRLKSLSLRSGGKDLSLDFAVGGVVYDPSSVSADYEVKNPRHLFHIAMKKVEKACERPERWVIEKYHKPSQQLLLGPFCV
ncbi:GGDEF domain-containing protein [Candidatus Woesearchaeota archaeon]|nr:GGDEF domain-containing protein [Candidatus Woesearchaeota archaeon]